MSKDFYIIILIFCMFIYLTSLLHLEATDMDYIQESNVSELGDKLIIK